MGASSCAVETTLVARSLLGGESLKFFFTGLLECGGVVVYFLLTNDEKQVHPLIPHRKTGESVPPEHENRSGVCLSIELQYVDL